MLKNSSKISNTTKTEFFELKLLQSEKKYDKTTAVQILEVFPTLSHVDFGEVLWHGAKKPRFLQSLILQGKQLWGSFFFFSEYSKCDIDLRNEKKK